MTKDIFKDLEIKKGKVYSKLGNRVFGIMFTYCEECKKYTKIPKMTKKDGKEWLHCERCGTQLDIPHIEFDRDFKNMNDLKKWYEEKIKGKTNSKCKN